MTGMDRAEFSWLLLHANLLPIMAMQQAIGEMHELLAHAEPLPDDRLSESQREEQSRIAMSDLADRIEADTELLALTDFNFFPPPLSAEELKLLEQQSHEEEAAEKQAMAGLEDIPDGPLDLDVLLARAYAKPVTTVHLDAAWALADIPKLVASIEQLPSELPPLTAPMDGSELALWLALFRTEEPQLTDLVFAVVRLNEEE